MKRGRRPGQNRVVEVERPAQPLGEIRCPACKGTEFVALAASDTQQRLQCGNDKCGEHFAVPKDCAAGLVKTLQEEAAAGPLPGDSRACPKCSKPFQRTGHWRDMHIANCTGKPWKGPRSKIEQAVHEEIAIGAADTALTVALVEPGRRPSLKARVLDFIRRERDFHEGEAEVGRKLIDAIGEVQA